MFDYITNRLHAANVSVFEGFNGLCGLIRSYFLLVHEPGAFAFKRTAKGYFTVYLTVNFVLSSSIMGIFLFAIA